ncbi:hypothetical protein PTKIN_Ptkin11bG0158700 [Pterospermum kingtungense]
MLSAGAIVTLAMIMMGIEKADEDAYQQWLINSDANFLRALSVLCRLYNDVQSNEDDELSGITCYMKECAVSREEVIEGLQERIRVEWKELNEGYMVRPKLVAS